MCPIRNWPDHFESPKLGHITDPSKTTVRVVGRRCFSVGLGLCESSPDFAKICLFLLDYQSSKRSRWISTRLGRILKRSRQISTRLGSISKRSSKISKRSSKITKRSGQISTRSHQISTNRTKSDWRTTSIGGESYFRCVFQSGQLKIGFPCSNPSINPSISGFGSEDPSQIVASVESASSRAGSAGLGGWVEYRV